MSDSEKKYTERDLILARRSAIRAVLDGESRYAAHPEGIAVLVNHYAPLPQVKRPRVVTLDDSEYKWVDGRVYIRSSGIASGAWRWFGESVSGCIAPARLAAPLLRLVADLIERPDELVDDDS